MSIFQHLFNATLLGLVLGLLAVRSGSIVPGILFHALNNGRAVSMGYASGDVKSRIASWTRDDILIGDALPASTASNQSILRSSAT